MKRIIPYIVLFVFGFFLQSCCGCNDQEVKEEPILTFAIAGHVYGNPDRYSSSIYPPFLSALKEDHTHRNYNFLFLTGDVVADSTNANWIAIENELDAVGIPWFIARGNHDSGSYLDENIQVEKYLSIRDHYALFLVLNMSHAGWIVD